MDYIDKTDEELIDAFYRGDREAMSVLFERHKQGVFSFVHRITMNRADAEDVVSEVFIRICDAKNRYVAQAKFKTWLFTIARNAALDHARQQKHRVSFWFKKPGSDELQSFEIEDPQDSAARTVENKEAGFYIQQALNRLPQDQKEALVLREYHDMNYEQIAVVLGCTLANVKVLIFRARAQLKNELPDFIREGR